jgi:hypothetical protein
MRIKSEMWVKAYLRRCSAQGVNGVIVRHGDDDAGAIFICVNLLDGTVRLYCPAPSMLERAPSDRRWATCFNGGAVSESDAEAYLARQWSIDPDLWVIEIDDRAGRHFLGDAIAG